MTQVADPARLLGLYKLNDFCHPAGEFFFCRNDIPREASEAASTDARASARIEHRVTDVLSWSDEELTYDELLSIFNSVHCDAEVSQQAKLFAALGLVCLALQLGKPLGDDTDRIKTLCDGATEGNLRLRPQLLLLMALDQSIGEEETALLRYSATTMMRSAPPGGNDDDATSLLCMHFCMLAQQKRDLDVLVHARATLHAATCKTRKELHDIIHATRASIVFAKVVSDAASEAADEAKSLKRVVGDTDKLESEVMGLMSLLTDTSLSQTDVGILIRTELLLLLLSRGTATCSDNLDMRTEKLKKNLAMEVYAFRELTSSLHRLNVLAHVLPSMVDACYALGDEETEMLLKVDRLCVKCGTHGFPWDRVTKALPGRLLRRILAPWVQWTYDAKSPSSLAALKAIDDLADLGRAAFAWLRYPVSSRRLTEAANALRWWHALKRLRDSDRNTWAEMIGKAETELLSNFQPLPPADGTAWTGIGEVKEDEEESYCVESWEF